MIYQRSLPFLNSALTNPHGATTPLLAVIAEAMDASSVSLPLKLWWMVELTSLALCYVVLQTCLADGDITLVQWQQSVREALKLAHTQAAIIGNGGRDNMQASDWGRIGQRLRAEYRYLEGFARDLLAGSVSTPMALARVSMYAQAVRGSYWEGTTIRQEKQGYSLMRRILDPQAKHCDDCLRYAARGTVSIGSLPMPGQRCACLSNCKCRVQYLRQQAPVVPV
jgi:hypothetical protein